MKITGKVYVVTSGEYSDYRIVGVFDNENLANLAKELEHDSNEVEIYSLNPNADEYNQGLQIRSVTIRKDGDVVVVKLREWGDNFTRGHEHKDEYVLTTCMWSKDDEHAIKTANERRGHLLAMNLWPVDGPPPYQIELDLFGKVREL